MKNKSVPNTKNIQMNNLEGPVKEVRSDKAVQDSSKNFLGSFVLDDKIIASLQSHYERYLSKEDTGDILIDFGFVGKQEVGKF
jgi:hypothetical protein